MNFSDWIHRLRRRRTIEVTTSGKWFLALTVAFGVTAVLSGNSILYLLESLLLGLLILSGVLSDRMLWNLSVKWQNLPVHAARPHEDRISITNHSRLPAMALELGEWTSQGFQLRGYLSYLKGKHSSDIPPAGTPHAERGAYEWSGRVVATRFPFGFARKLKWIEPDGRRWVRPKLNEQTLEQRENSNRAAAGFEEYEEGAIRPFLLGEDYRDIAWIYSDSLKGPHFQRVRSSTPEQVTLTLESKGLRGEALEGHLSFLATELAAAEKTGSPVEFVVPSDKQRDHLSEQVIDDIPTALDFLARHPKL